MTSVFTGSASVLTKCQSQTGLSWKSSRLMMSGLPASILIYSKLLSPKCCIATAQHFGYFHPPVILSEPDRRRREGAVEGPRYISSAMQRQEILTKHSEFPSRPLRFNFKYV